MHTTQTNAELETRNAEPAAALPQPSTLTPQPSPSITYHGRDAYNKPECAIIRHPLNPEARDAVYARLTEAARHHPLLTKRWRVWSVMCTDDWAVRHANANKPPK